MQLSRRPTVFPLLEEKSKWSVPDNPAEEDLPADMDLTMEEVAVVAVMTTEAGIEVDMTEIATEEEEEEIEAALLLPAEVIMVAATTTAEGNREGATADPHRDTTIDTMETAEETDALPVHQAIE